MDYINKLISLFHYHLNCCNPLLIPSVVFDIDGTILNDGVFSPKDYDEVILNVYRFLLYLQSIDIPIFIITARPDYPHNRKETKKMLDKLGINYVKLYMHNQSENNHIDFKTKSRKNILDNGYKVIMSLGDNYWDYGDYGGLGVHIYNNGEKMTFH
tara:strand:+ start:221 stop:688 length:468 start_codon:yes stop_codon:yes gene_type:complete